jgi:hypothetical protein
MLWDQRTRVTAGFIGWLAALIGAALVTVAVVCTLSLYNRTLLPSTTSHLAIGDQLILVRRTAALVQLRK